MSIVPLHRIRASFDARTIRVYQAYREEIAEVALANGTFLSPPFSMSRMTWIKPSFLWMMYRAGWGFKDAGQARILGIDITREGFEWALAHGCLSHRDPSLTDEEWTWFKKQHPVRIQWDPERDLQLRPLPHSSLQMGLECEALERYCGSWIVAIEDKTALAHEMRGLVDAGKLQEAEKLLPVEEVYPIDRPELLLLLRDVR